MCRSIYRYHWAKKSNQEVDNLNFLFDEVAISNKPQLLWVIFYYDISKQSPQTCLSNDNKKVIQVIWIHKEVYLRLFVNVCMYPCLRVRVGFINTSYSFKNLIKHHRFGCGFVECLEVMYILCEFTISNGHMIYFLHLYRFAFQGTIFSSSVDITIGRIRLWIQSSILTLVRTNGTRSSLWVVSISPL